MDDINQVMESANRVDEAITAVDKYLEPLLAIPPEELAQKLGHVEHAKLNAGLAYAINTLYFVYLRTVGVDTASHGVRKELDRVKSYITKIKKSLAKQDKRKEAIDKGAASRSCECTAAPSSQLVLTFIFLH